MRVAFIVPYLRTPSGWRSLSIGIVQSLQERAGVVPVPFVSEEDVDQARILLPDCDQIVVPRTQRMALRSVRSWPGALNSWWQIHRKQVPNVDLVHSLEAYPTGLVGHWLAMRLEVPHVITTAGTYGVVWHESRLDRLAYSTVLQHAACLCPISHGTASLIRHYFGGAIPDTCLQVIFLGTGYHQQVPRNVALHRPPSTVPTLLSVGAVKSRKGYHISLAAFAKVKEQLPSARYLIVGSFNEDDPYYTKLQEFIAGHQLRDVEFTGVVSHEQLQKCYQQALVFLLTPQQHRLHFEGFGLVYLEAGAYGLPVVGTRVGGVPDAIREGVTGFLTGPDDVDGIAEALLRLLTDVDLARRMGRANREWAETLTWERFAGEQYRVYEDVLAASSVKQGDRF